MGTETLARQRHRRGVLWVITGLGCGRSRVQIPGGEPPLLKVPVSNEIDYKHEVGLGCVHKGAFIVCCNGTALPMYRLPVLIYRSSAQLTALEVHFLAVPQCSSRHRDGNTTTATYRNADAEDYERTLNVTCTCRIKICFKECLNILG